MLLYFFLIVPVFSGTDPWAVSHNSWCRDYYTWDIVKSDTPLSVNDGLELSLGFKDYCEWKEKNLLNKLNYLHTRAESNPIIGRMNHWIYKDCLHFIDDTIIFRMYLGWYPNYRDLAKKFAQENDTPILHPRTFCKWLEERPNFSCLAVIGRGTFPEYTGDFKALFCAFCSDRIDCTKKSSGWIVGK